jgi:hypothetical protein
MAEFTPTNLGVFVCAHILSNTRPVLLVVHDEYDWQFLCGETHPEGEIPSLVGVGHLTTRDPTLSECADLPQHFEAERSSLNDLWIRTPIEPRPSNNRMERTHER